MLNCLIDVVTYLSNDVYTLYYAIYSLYHEPEYYPISIYSPYVYFQISKSSHKHKQDVKLSTADFIVPPYQNQAKSFKKLSTNETCKQGGPFKRGVKY